MIQFDQGMQRFNYRIVRLLWLVENFFEHDGRRYHELALYFLIRFHENSLPRTSVAFDRTEGGVLFRFRWHPVQTDLLVQLPLLPAFLPQALTELPISVVHIVERNIVHAQPLSSNAAGLS